MRVNFRNWIPAFAGMTCGVLLFSMTFGVFPAMATECLYQDGGYFVSQIAGETVKLTPFDKLRVNGVGGVAVLSFYESLWDEMVKLKVATQKDRDNAFKAAEEAGGTKIGGVNLVVLAAGTLQELANEKVITEEKAQEILNEAKK